jgi:hypothetical protein
MKRPADQFYPGDWLNDAALRACSLAARGLWKDMNCIMHQGHPYGHLTRPAKDGDEASFVPFSSPSSLVSLDPQKRRLSRS